MPKPNVFKNFKCVLTNISNLQKEVMKFVWKKLDVKTYV